MPTVRCDHCGAEAAADAVRLTWSSAVEAGRARRYCERCTREHLRAAESGLDSTWW